MAGNGALVPLFLDIFLIVSSTKLRVWFCSGAAPRRGHHEGASLLGGGGGDEARRLVRQVPARRARVPW